MFKKIFLNPIAVILELAAIITLNEKSEMETYQALLSTYLFIDKGFPPFHHVAFNKKV